jgi:hypothetical protein
VSPDLRGTLASLADQGYRCLLLLATTEDGRVRTRGLGVDVLRILPGSDIAAVLEGRQ